jgi:hypothetical protein
VRSCAAGARRHGCAPEKFLAALERSLDDEALARFDRGYREALRSRIVTWAIAAFFAAVDDGGVARARGSRAAGR